MSGRTRASKSSPTTSLAVPVIDASVAVAASTRAAQQAIELLAYEQAITHYEQALEFQALTDIEPAERARLPTRWRRHRTWPRCLYWRWRRAGRRPALARLAARPDLLAQIGLETGEPFVMLTTDDERVAILEDALNGLPHRDDPTRAVAMAGLGAALLFTDQVERKEALFDFAVAMARRLDDPATLARSSPNKPRILDRRRRPSARRDDRVVALAEQVGDRRLGLRGRSSGSASCSVRATGDAPRRDRRLRTPRYCGPAARLLTGHAAPTGWCSPGWRATGRPEALLGGAANYRGSGQATGRVAVAIATRCLRFAQAVAPSCTRSWRSLAPQYHVRRAPGVSRARCRGGRSGRRGARGAVAPWRAWRRLPATSRGSLVSRSLAKPPSPAVTRTWCGWCASCCSRSGSRSSRSAGQPPPSSDPPVHARPRRGSQRRARRRRAAYEAAIDTCRQLGAPVLRGRHTVRPGPHAACRERRRSRAGRLARGRGDGDRRRVGVVLPLNEWRHRPRRSRPRRRSWRSPQSSRRRRPARATCGRSPTPVRIRPRPRQHRPRAPHPVARQPEAELTCSISPPANRAAHERRPARRCSTTSPRRSTGAGSTSRAEVAEATEWNDDVRAAKAEAELGALTDELRRAVGLGGRSSGRRRGRARPASPSPRRCARPSAASRSTIPSWARISPAACARARSAPHRGPALAGDAERRRLGCPQVR